jgi:ATP-dependent DNA helicase RecG
VRIFDDRLEVESPGGLPGIVTVENIRQRHFSRNPVLVGVLRTWHFIEELGFGIDRVFRAMEEIGAPPPKITDDHGVVTVTLYSSDGGGNLIDEAGLNPRQLKAWQYIQSAGSISRKQYAELVGLSPATAFRDLDAMVDKGLLRTVGGGRSRRYIQAGEIKSA